MWLYTRNANKPETEDNKQIHKPMASVASAHQTSNISHEHPGVLHARELFGVTSNTERAVEKVIEPVAPWVEVVKPLERYDNLMEHIDRHDNDFMSQMDGHGWWDSEQSGNVRICPTCGALMSN